MRPLLEEAAQHAAGALRLVAALLHTIMHIERTGDLAVNIAKLVPLMGDPPSGAGSDIMPKLEAASAQARDQLKQAQIAFEQRNLDLAENLVTQDDVIDALNRQIFQEAIESGGSDPGSSELLPDPATPVTTHSTPRGTSTSTSFRLWREAPRISR